MRLEVYRIYLLLISLLFFGTNCIADNGSDSYVIKQVWETSGGSNPSMPWYNEIMPRGYYKNNKTYFCWQGDNYDPYVMMFDHTTNVWMGPVKCGDNSLRWEDNKDSHGNPCIFVDANNYIHIFYGCHVSPLKHTKSNSAEDITSWTEQTVVTDYATYPQVFSMSDGTVYIYFIGAEYQPLL